MPYRLQGIWDCVDWSELREGFAEDFENCPSQMPTEDSGGESQESEAAEEPEVEAEAVALEEPGQGVAAAGPLAEQGLKGAVAPGYHGPAGTAPRAR